MTKLDLETIQNYDFDLAQGKQFKKKEERSRQLPKQIKIDKNPAVNIENKTKEVRRGIDDQEEKVEMGIPETTELLE